MPLSIPHIQVYTLLFLIFMGVPCLALLSYGVACKARVRDARNAVIEKTVSRRRKRDSQRQSTVQAYPHSPGADRKASFSTNNPLVPPQHPQQQLQPQQGGGRL